MEPKVGSLWVWGNKDDVTVEKVLETGLRLSCVTVYSTKYRWKAGEQFSPPKFYFLKEWNPCSNLFGLLIGEIGD